MKKFLGIVLVLTSLTGCATLNKKECGNANWKMVGLEDGSQGRELSFIGKHRSACAKYNITPDLEAYRQGYSEGIRQFCTPASGKTMGISGGVYRGVCPSELEGPFLKNYNMGRELYFKLLDINSITSDLASNKSELEDLRDELRTAKDQMISSGNSEEDRSRLMRDIDSLQNKIDGIERKLISGKRKKEQLELEAENIRETLKISETD